jgi:hypothetical protein
VQLEGDGRFFQSLEFGWWNHNILCESGYRWNKPLLPLWITEMEPFVSGGAWQGRSNA